MNSTILILDAKPDYLAGGPLSLLDLPLEQGTLLEQLCAPLRDAGDEVIVVRPFAERADNERFAQRHALDVQTEVLGAEDVVGALTRKEPSDWLMFVAPVYWPEDTFDPREVLDCAREAREVTHLVAPSLQARFAQERVMLDGGGRVRRIQRYYPGVTQVDACRVACSAMPASVAQVSLDEPVRSLMELRRCLAGFGIPSRDLTAAGGFADLSSEAGVLALMEHRLRAAEATRPGLVVQHGSDCQIHASARLYGPIVLHERVALDADAIVIGPAIVGADSRIERGGIVTHSLLSPGTCVPRQTAVFQRVVAPSRGAATDRLGTVAATSPRAALRPLGVSPAPAPRAARPWYPGVKRVLDVVLAGAGLIVLSPLLLATALVIKLTSRGPVLFSHVREGRGGREFRCWKFRTMVDNAHALQRRLYTQNQVDGPQFKLAHDPRITRVGRWLRTTNIDELPQLINVVLGHMSLIGPRPSPFRENQICVPWRQARLSVRPGISGLWQICRHQRAAGDFHQWIHYDMLYVRHLSLGLDLKIVLFTFLTLAGRWSVPARWLVPDRQLVAQGGSDLPTRVPILDLAVGAPAPSAIDPTVG